MNKMSPLNEKPLMLLLELYKRGETEEEIRRVLSNRISSEVLESVMMVCRELSNRHGSEILKYRELLYDDVYNKKRMKITLEYMLSELIKYKRRSISDFEEQLESGKNVLEIK